MVNVLVINTVPMDMNGITNVILNLHKNIQEEKCHMDFVAINDLSEDYKKKLEGSNSKVYIIKGRMKKTLQYIIKLYKISRNYDVVHVHGNSATMVIELFAAAIAGVKFRIAHSHSSTCKYLLLDRLCRPFFYLLCNGKVACGEEAGRWLFHNRNFLLLKNGIETEQYSFSMSKRINIREKLGWDRNIILAHIGAFNSFKNQNFIIDIFEKIYKENAEYRLLLIGDGEKKKELEKKVNNLGLNQVIIFYGITKKVNELLNGVDIILMPSFNEGYPLTLLEAQANGAPCLISDRITKDINISGDIKFLSIDYGIENWINAILKVKGTKNRSEKSKENIQKIIKSGYDIKVSAKIIMDYYCRGITLL